MGKKVSLYHHSYINKLRYFEKSPLNIDKKLLDKADSIERYLVEIQRKYENVHKEK